MVKRGDYIIENFYQETPTSFTPGYDSISTSYKMNVKNIGLTTNPTTANQIKELGEKLRTGAMNVEVGTLGEKEWETIPKQHFKELRRMAKLAGAKVSIHAPIIEPSGIDIRENGGGEWDETKREMIEKKFEDVVDKAVEVDKDENVPITIHAANIPGTEFKIENGEKKIARMAVVDKETGQIKTFLSEDKRYYPEGMKEGEIEPVYQDPQKKLETLNLAEWDDSTSEALFQLENTDRIISETLPVVKEYQKIQKEAETNPEAYKKIDPEKIQLVEKRLVTAYEYLKEAERKAHNLFDKAWKLTDKNEEERKKLIEISKKYQEGLKEISSNDLQAYSQQLSRLIVDLKKVQPEKYVRLEEFAVEKSSETFSNVALHAVKKYGEKAPIINIENLYSGIAFSSGEDVEKLVKETKKKFVEKAIKPTSEGGLGLSKSQAEAKADKFIGITFDVGHLNISRSKGFSEEDLLKEAKRMAKHVKHVHITDNFGYNDSHLSPGMGNVPIKKLLEVLEKEGDLESMRKIIEVGGIQQQFGYTPTKEIFSAFSSPVYSTPGTNIHWDQTPGFWQDYNVGRGEFLPPIHYGQFGAGFSQLPTELGGQQGRGAPGSRFSGRGID